MLCIVTHMNDKNVIVRFENVSFEYGPKKPILKEVSFPLRKGTKTTIMGQNGAGKSTMFKLINGELSTEEGQIHLDPNITIATSRQVIPRDELELSVKDFFAKCFKQKIYDIDPRIDKILEVVHLNAPHDRKVGSFSGGQQARLLLASALIQNPDLLLLDEPTNNLDKAGIEHLTQFLVDYKKTVLVISHDSEFLNAFTQGVLYLDVHTQKVEQYVGNYNDVVSQIEIRIERERRKNAQFEKQIQENKEKANFFANKGGQMRLVAKKMREKAEEMEEEKVDMRKEDKTIRPFVIPSQDGLSGDVIKISSFKMIKDHKPTKRTAKIALKKNDHLLIVGPNGVGKTTLLESIARGKATGIEISPNTVVGYYRQDFSTLDFNDTVYDCLARVMDRPNDEKIRSTSASFLITKEIIDTKIGMLSEGQKGLVSFARLVLQRPGLLILDEPTNHINFRHIPVIAKALNDYEGAMILVSHVPEFVKQIRIDQTLDMMK